MWNIHFLIVFVHICNLWGLYLSWYSYLYIFCLYMFLTASGWSAMAWQMRSLPPWEAFHWYVPKIIFCSMYTSVSPQKHFFNIMNFMGIASHIPCTFLFHYSINFHVYMLLSVCILIFLHIFCLEMFGIDRGCRDMAWQINPFIFDWRLQWHFSQVDTTLRIWHSTKLTFLSDVWVLLHFWAYFTKFGCTISYSSYIHHCFIKMWYMLLK